MKHILFIIMLSVSFTGAYSQQKSRIIANPLNLNYRFQPEEPSRREAADPVIEYYKGKYYLFASKSGGYWSSPDMVDWTYIPCTSIANIESYAPTVLVLRDTLYYLASGSPQIHYTTTPDVDNWKLLTPQRLTYSETDFGFFYDEDTDKVYLYWGCSDRDPIKGIELDHRNNFKAIGSPKILIEHHTDLYGWEIPGAANDENRVGWNEGPDMIKHNGKYYLQYAAPGTEYRVYGDGVYVSDSPLGPFTYMENSPFSIKPGGFIGGAGHGHTFKDKYGNYWHTATMRISKRHSFERRIGLFPVWFDANGNMYAHTVLTDYPFEIPDSKVDFSKNDLSLGWNLLSYKKKATASSTNMSYAPQFAVNETVELWWSAQTGDAGEWLQVDLGSEMQVNALQINFADVDFTNLASNSYTYYQYYVEASKDGENWTMIIDRRTNTLDAPHELIVLDAAQTARYLRITNAKTIDGKFSLFGFRAFGKGSGEAPGEVANLRTQRKEDTRRFIIRWDAVEGATGYILHWGVKPDQLNNAVMLFDVMMEAGYFNRDSKYYFSVDAFNENGITKGKTIVEARLKAVSVVPLQVYPNPADDIFHISLPGKGRVMICDIFGRELLSSIQETTIAEFDASSYPPGVYFVSYISSNKKETVKVIKS